MLYERMIDFEVFRVKGAHSLVGLTELDRQHLACLRELPARRENIA
jgi:hypothetical protein